ncbi:unnamed protein product [Lactuca virosa]|uniref:Uncharacterized protein n=1 Tax=Lactuca virosa TaxID=75947 RepID=A0AAU9P6E9_9ASTR|nr:unnamed protein product [Lactuca virosa]
MLQSSSSLSPPSAPALLLSQKEGAKVGNQKGAADSDVCSEETPTSVVGSGQGTKKKWRMKGGKAATIAIVFRGSSVTTVDRKRRRRQAKEKTGEVEEATASCSFS